LKQQNEQRTRQVITDQKLKENGYQQIGVQYTVSQLSKESKERTLSPEIIV
jgi:hypothetical protein